MVIWKIKQLWLEFTSNCICIWYTWVKFQLSLLLPSQLNHYSHPWLFLCNNKLNGSSIGGKDEKLMFKLLIKSKICFNNFFSISVLNEKVKETKLRIVSGSGIKVIITVIELGYCIIMICTVFLNFLCKIISRITDGHELHRLINEGSSE